MITSAQNKLGKWSGILLISLALQGCGGSEEEPYKELSAQKEADFNEYLLSLSFDPNAILDVQNISGTSEKVSGGAQQSGSGDEFEYLACVREDFSLKQNFDEIAILRPTEGVIWPGALVVGDKDLLNGAPKPVGLRRGSLTLSVDLPGIGDQGIIELEDSTFSAAALSIDTALRWWNDYAYQEGYVNASNSSYQTAVSYSQEQLAMDLGVNVQWVGGQSSGQFNFTTTSESKVVMLTFKQAFYKVTIDTPHSPAQVFSGNVSIADIKNTFSNGAPPAYVHSVSYGRIINFRMTTSASATEAELKAALEFTSGTERYDVDLEARYKQILSESTVDVFSIGGNAAVASLATGSNNLQELQSIISGKNAVYSKENPGVPIAYTIRFLNDNSLAKMGYTTEYATELCNVYTKGYVKVDHSGGYVAKYTLSYEQNGESKSFGSGDFSLGFSKRIDIPANATHIKVKAEAYTGLIWDPRNTILEEDFLANPGNICYTVKGTTLNTSYTTDECD